MLKADTNPIPVIPQVWAQRLLTALHYITVIVFWFGIVNRAEALRENLKHLISWIIEMHLMTRNVLGLTIMLNMLSESIKKEELSEELFEEIKEVVNIKEGTP